MKKTDYKDMKEEKLEDFAKPRLDAKGREIPDSRPMTLPVGFRNAPSLQEQMMQMFKNMEYHRAVARAGMESFEEADDFDVPDDTEEFDSPYESDFESPITNVDIDPQNEEKETQPDGQTKQNDSNNGSDDPGSNSGSNPPQDSTGSS